MSASPAHAQRLREILAAHHSPAFSTTIRADPERATVTPHGELDLHTVAIVDGDIAALCDVGFQSIIVDLRELTSIDAAGINLLLMWSAQAGSDRHEFRIIPGSDRIQLRLRLSGLLESLAVAAPRRAS